MISNVSWYNHSRKAQTDRTVLDHPKTCLFTFLESAISCSKRHFLGGQSVPKRAKRPKTCFSPRVSVPDTWHDAMAQLDATNFEQTACEANPVNPCSLKLPKGINAPFCKLDVNTSRQTFLGYNMHFWHTNYQTGPKKGAKPHQKGAKTVKKAHIGISALTCFCDTGLLCHFRLHNGQNTDLDSSKFSKPTIWLAGTSKKWFIWLTCGNWTSSSD